MKWMRNLKFGFHHDEKYELAYFFNEICEIDLMKKNIIFHFPP